MRRNTVLKAGFSFAIMTVIWFMGWTSYDLLELWRQLGPEAYRNILLLCMGFCWTPFFVSELRGRPAFVEKEEPQLLSNLGLPEIEVRGVESLSSEDPFGAVKEWKKSRQRGRRK